jgi:predicted nucleic acid-binding protein
MSEFVIDCSVAIKWLFLEKGSDQSEKLIGKFSTFLIPALFLIEMDAVITKKVRIGELKAEKALDKSKAVRKLPFQIVEYDEIFSLIFDLATSLPITLYDATYVATAIEYNAVVYTADQRLVNGLSNTMLNQYVKSIWDIT